MLIQCTNNKYGLYYHGIFYPYKGDIGIYYIDNQNVEYNCFSLNEINEISINKTFKYIVVILRTQTPLENKNIFSQFDINLDDFSIGNFYFIYDICTNSVIIKKHTDKDIYDNYNDNISRIPTYFLVCRPHYYKFVEDYISSISYYLNWIVLLENNKLEYDDNYILFFLENVFCPNIYKKIYLNVEQLTRINFLNILRNILINKSYITICDYTVENNMVIGRDNWIIPYMYNPIEIQHLKKLYDTTEKIYDVAFCGSMSPYRNRLLEELKSRGIKVLVISYSNNQMWKDDRDREIAKCKVLLNIHFNPDYNIYEHIRCDRWVFAGMPVISQDSIYYKELDVYKNNLIIFHPYENLVEETIKFLQLNEISDKSESVKKIANERFEKLQKFVEFTLSDKFK